jgi:hypothetical protein
LKVNGIFGVRWNDEQVGRLAKPYTHKAAMMDGENPDYTCIMAG